LKNVYDVETAFWPLTEALTTLYYSRTNGLIRLRSPEKNAVNIILQKLHTVEA